MWWGARQSVAVGFKIDGRREFLDLSCVVGTLFDELGDEDGKTDMVLSGKAGSSGARALLGVDCRDEATCVVCLSGNDLGILILRLRGAIIDSVMEVMSVVECESAVDLGNTIDWESGTESLDTLLNL